VEGLERDGMLVVPAIYDPGLAAEVDGAPAAVVRVDGALSGVSLAAGTHHVAIRLHGDPYPWIAALWLLTYLGLAAAFLFAWDGSPPAPACAPDSAPEPTVPARRGGRRRVRGRP
jgi:uncharacterized membrane protein YfhO